MKPENILINNEGRQTKAYVADVGVARLFDPQSVGYSPHSIGTITGTLEWMAPEMLAAYLSSGKGIKIADIFKLDIFSLGLLALFCWDYKEFQKQRDLNKDQIALIKYLRTLRFRYPRKKAIPIINSDDLAREKLPLGVYYLLRCMLCFDNEIRPCVEEAYKDILKFFEEHMVKY